MTSSRKFPPQNAHEKRAVRRAKREHRATFPERWSRFINTYFGDPVEAAAFFGCDPDTAEGWMTGSHGASGAFVDYAYSNIPEVGSYLSGR